MAQNIVITRCQFWPSGIVVACVCVYPSVCVNVRVSVNYEFVRTITQQPCKLGSPNLDHRCKRPWLRSPLFLGWLTLTFKVKFNFKVKIYPHLSLWVCPRHKSARIVVRISKFGPKCILALLRSLLILGLSFIFTFIFNFKPVISTKFWVSYSFASVCIYLMRPSPVNAPHSTWHRTYTDSHARGQGRAMDRGTV